MTKTICHWFLQSNGTLYNGNVFSKTFLFKPPADIAGKICIFKLTNAVLANQLPMPVSIYMKGLTFSQNACVDPSFTYYGEISPTKFYQLVGDENRSQLIGNIGTFPTTAIDDEMPYLLVYVPPGPTYVELGIFTNNVPETDTNRHLEFPPNAMTANTVVLSDLRIYGQGTYTASVSGPNGTATPYLLFDKNNTTGGNIGDGYIVNNGAYAGNIYTEIGKGDTKQQIFGAYVQLAMSTPIPFYRLSITSGNANAEPRRIVIVGSMDNIYWDFLYASDTDLVYSSGQNILFFQPLTYNAISYNIYRIIVTEVGITGGASLDHCHIHEIRLYAFLQQQIPPASLTASPVTLTGQTYMNGTYTVSVSGPNGTTTPWALFDGNTAINNNIGDGYITPSGNYTGTQFTIDEFTGTAYYGAYVTIELPRRISIQSYRILRQTDANRPGRFVILGSNDDIKYYMVHNNSTFEAVWSGGNTQNSIIQPFNTQYYKFYRILATRIGLVNIGGTMFGLAEIILYGNNSAWNGNAHFITEFEPLDAIENED